MQDVDKTGLLLELPKFRKSSKVSQDDESNESVSSGFRSGPDSESAHSGDEALTNYRKISNDYGFGESPITRELLRPKSCLTRSKSAPVGKLPLHASSELPRVTLNDFSALTIDPVEEIQDFQQSDTFTCVTLEDVRCATRQSRLLKNQKSFEFDTWSCTNSSIGTSLDELASESEKEDILELRKPIKKPSGWRKVRNMVQWTPFIQEFKNRKYQWVQLAGHSGNFKAGRSQGTVLKKLCPQEEHCYNQFSQDSIAPYVPEYQGTICLDNDEKFIQLQDCLSTFVKPSIMDCKIGVRTYLEEELAKAKEKPKLRKDMFDKMIAVDPLAPTEEERRMKGVTKPRYMVWRETISSTATLGFRIEGVKKNDGTSSKEFKTTKTRDQVIDAFSDFISSSVIIARQYLERLQCIKKALSSSNFFSSHELIGSSLLFVHDSSKACVWLIDFGKTVPLPDGTRIDHKTPWVVGNHEDGYLIGVDNLISIFTQLVTKLES